MVNMELLGTSSEENQKLKIQLPDQHEKNTYNNLSGHFIDHKVDYRKQYCKIYTVRLEKMFELLQNRIKSKWGTKYPVVKVHKLQEAASEKCIIVGTLFKEQKLKPSILKKISEVNSLIPQPIYTHFADETDQLFIEDDLQRFQIIGNNIDIQKLVTGISCAFLGSDQGKGKFWAEDICFVECRPQIERPINNPERYIAFLSGLDLINYEKVVIPLKLCIEYLCGFLNDVSKVSRLVVAGNSIRIDPETKSDVKLETTVVVSNDVLESVKRLDTVLSQFSRFMNIDIMPGQYDPSNHLFTQQPMHKCMFPMSSQFENFQTVTNPYQFEVDGVKILGSSGQPVTDIMSYSTIETPIKALKKSLIWSHICPTSPDTLACYPYYNNDPFIIEEAPHVYFAANQPEFQTKVHTGPEGQNVRLVCVPQFAKSASIVLLNLSNLECHSMNFEVFNG